MSCPRHSENVSCTDIDKDNIEEVSESNKSESEQSEAESEPCSEKSSQQLKNETNPTKPNNIHVTGKSSISA